MEKTAEAEVLALAIPALCKASGISIRHFYELQRRGEGPPVVRLGRRRVVRREAAEAWLRRREAA